MRYTYLILVFTAVYSQIEQDGVPEATVELLNTGFKNDVSGSGQDIWGLMSVLYNQKQLVNGENHDMILLLNNTYSLELDLHRIRVFNRLGESEYSVSQHVEAQNSNSTEAQEVIKQAAEDSGYSSLEFLNEAIKQELTVESTVDVGQSEEAAPGTYVFSLYRGRVSSGDQIIDITVVTSSNSTDERSIYTNEQYDIEEILLTNTSSTTIFVMSMLLLSCASMACVYTVILCYYKRRGKLPCFDRKIEDQMHLHFPGAK